MRGAAFVVLDRDGTLILDRHYLDDPAGVELLPGASALARLCRRGLPLVVVTNQSGVARGLFSIETVARVNARVRELLAASGVALAAIYVCPHGPDEKCACRKPARGLVDRAARALGLRAEDAFFVGDRACDIELGRGVGGTTLLVRSGRGAEPDAEQRADHVVENLDEAVTLIERLLGD